MNAGPEDISIAILATSTVDLLAVAIRSDLAGHGTRCTIWHAGFNQYRQEILDPQSALYACRPDVVLLYLEGEDLFADSLSDPFAPRERHIERAREAAVEFEQLLQALQATLPDTFIVLHTVYLRPLHGLTGLEHHGPLGIGELAAEYNRELARIARTYPNVVVHDTAALAAHYGYRDWFDSRLWYMARCRLGSAAIDALAQSVGSLIRGWQGRSRKCLVLDLDHTLWGGLIGEDGITGISLGPEGLGRAFLEFQMEIAKLARRGVLLAICSKNDPDHALAAIREHPAMRLREDDFSAIRISWDDKASGVRQIAAELNLGLDSLVFIDDNPVERERVRSGAAGVLVPEWPADPSDFKAALIDLAIHEFPRIRLTAEDEGRTAMYQAEQRRRVAVAEHPNLEQYLRSLSMTASVGRASDTTCARVAQLTQKTNQFNLTSRRYTEADIRQMMRDPRVLVLWLELRDRFGDEGIVGVLILKETEDEAWNIDAFLLSCRVIGRSVETAFMARAVNALASRGAKEIRAEYISTARNSVAADVYARLGFRPAGSNAETTFWHFCCVEDRIAAPDWISVETAMEVNACSKRN